MGEENLGTLPFFFSSCGLEVGVLLSPDSMLKESV